MKITNRRAATAIAMLAGVALGGGVLLETADAEPKPLEVEVSEDMAKFLMDDEPTFDDGLPAAGNSFVTQGYIYEPGTLADGGGVNADGTATHPEAVLGTWICEGVFIGDGAHSESGAWVVTSQVFDFGEFDGDDTIVTHGIEISDIGVEVRRAVTGGTGAHRDRRGDQIQTLEGFNDGGGVNLTVEFDR